ncbi:MAG: GWxTD domain-containing protein [Candidatus Cloacimonadota bacterium]|nr:GWxTD domain-containing protein [Candidatus Cloacimonadota bacterium]
MKIILTALILIGLISCISIDRVLLHQKEGYVFSELKNESKLVGYFLTTVQKDYFSKLDADSKWQFISDFWETQNNYYPTSCFVKLYKSDDYNELQQEIADRVKYANIHFSHFKDGWETDMGKVYIKYGEPFEILKFTNYGEPYEIFEPQNSGHYVKLAERQYYIWKYRTSHFRTFLFIEPQQHGDLRLIYSDGEEQYGSWREWKDYLGTDFDASLLH